MNPGDKVDGLLLCRAAGERLAFPASQVVAVETWIAQEGMPHARTAFGLPAQRGRALVTESGDAVAVDQVEVLQDTVTLLAPPSLVDRGAGGSLAGFATARDTLWPVLDVAAFSRFVAGLGGTPR